MRGTRASVMVGELCPGLHEETAMKSHPPLRHCSILISSLLLMLAGSAPRICAQATEPLANEIRVTLLGTGTPRPLMDKFGPSILVETGKEKLIFDVGRGAT